jgi:hypothetical protein
VLRLLEFDGQAHGRCHGIGLGGAALAKLDDSARGGLANVLARFGQGQALGGKAAGGILDHRNFEGWAEQILRFGAGVLVASEGDDGRAILGGQGGVEADLADKHIVDPDGVDAAVGPGVVEHAFLGARERVVADQHNGMGRGLVVNALEHGKR